MLLLLAAPAWAQDQTLVPGDSGGDASNETDVFDDACAAACNAVACEAELTDTVGSPDGLHVSSTTDNATILFDFPTPSANPSTTAGAQALHMVVSRCDDDASCSERSGGGDPDFTATLFCNGTTTATTVWAAETVTAMDQTKGPATFTFPGACASDGSDFQVQVTFGRSGGSPANRNWPCIDVLEWEVTHAAAGATRRIFSIQ
jgi:hypothetical protein